MSRQLQQPSIIEVTQDPNLFGEWFNGPSWSSWMTFLRTLFALPFNDADLAIYEHHTHRPSVLLAPFREAWCCVGRRGGKSLIAALIATYLAVFRDYSSCLKRGEVGTIAVVAADRRQARTILRYIRGMLDIDALNGIVINDTLASIELRNNITIEIHTASFRTSRGYSLVAALVDEIAFFRSDTSANPDKEILSSLRPGLATTNGLLLCISSPYSRRGSLWEAYSRHFGKDSRVLFWKGTTQEMNPSIDPAVIEDALEEDEPAARAEFFAEFRTDTETFVRREVVEAAVVRGRMQLERSRPFVYRAFCDPSGGSSDSFTMGIAHTHRLGGGAADRCVLDLVMERRPPFSPDEVVREFSEVLKRFGISKVVGDRYGGLWPVERFSVHGILYEQSARPKSEIYLDTLPLLNSNRVELLDHPKLITQLLGLERRTSSMGRDVIDHSPGAHDDIINAAAGALLLASTKQAGVEMFGIF